MKFAAATLIGVACAVSASAQTPSSPDRRPYEVKTFHAERRVEGFKLIFDLPVVTHSPRLAAVVARTMEQFRREQTSSLRSYCAEKVSGETVPGEPKETCEGEQVSSTEVALADGHLLSVVISTFSDTKGAAHPSHCTTAYTWTVHSPRLLAMADLFFRGKSYLPQVSAIVRAKLQSDSDLADLTDLRWINEGTAPELHNFGVWSVTEHGLTIIFNEYQVAAYVAGPQEVPIAFSELETLIDPRGPVGYLTK